jgi:hypothetical protein
MLTYLQPLGVAPFNVAIQVFADGPTKVFRIADPATPMPIPHPAALTSLSPPPSRALSPPRRSSLAESLTSTHPPESAASVSFVVRAQVSSVGVSIIDATPQVFSSLYLTTFVTHSLRSLIFLKELAYMSFEGIELFFAASAQEQEFNFVIRKFQVYNKLNVNNNAHPEL